MSDRDTPCRVTLDTNAYYSKMANLEMRDEMTDDEIREKVLESPEFAEHVAEAFTEYLGNYKDRGVICAILANYMLSRAGHLRRHEDKIKEVGEYTIVHLEPIARKVLEDDIEYYREHNDITYGAEDE